MIKMNLAISNIAWTAEMDTQIYNLMKKYGFSGLEIAPTRIFPIAPYDKREEAQNWCKELNVNYGFSVVSMQSIWFGRQERIFGSAEERQILLDYTKNSICFAEIMGCNNLVFGCPKNRNILAGSNPNEAISFFKKLGDYAAEHGTVIGMEANPPIYNTNYINDTASAINLIREVKSCGFLLNLDVGTMICNNENVDILRGNVSLINHVHISEPNLKPIEKRKLHSELRQVLTTEGYKDFVSIEMGRVDDIRILEEKMSYVRSIFG